jgi:putative DNA-invertase from lambdoid prophage Rac
LPRFKIRLALKLTDAEQARQLDRMFRLAADALATLARLKAKAPGYLIDMGGDVLANNVGKLMFGVFAAGAGCEREQIAERISEVKAHLVAQGVYGGGKRPFGFDVVDGRLKPNASAACALA